MKVQIYEWLKGDGNSWIETKKNLERLTMRLFPNQETDDFQFITGVNGALRLSRNHNDLRNSDGSNVYLRNCGNTIIDVDINKERIIVNGNTFPYYINTLNGETFLFWGNQYYRLEFIYRGCIGEVVSDKFHLRPCRLLSPYTDAQGKLHPIGECCMIDINTNTLYFNSGSGAFSVEGEAGEIIDTTPYSRIMHGRNEVVVRLREWLKGDGKSFILVDHKLTQNSKMEMSAKMCSLIGTSALWGVECTEGSWTDGVWHIYQNRNGNLYNKNGLFDNYLGTYNEGDILDIVDEFSQTIINGNVYPTNRVTPILSKKVGILTAVQVNAQGDFVHGAGISWYGSVGKCSLYENGVEIIHLHPCDILHHPTLPPQSCMIDLLTGQLYTNQGTGNFTCEGADLGIWQSNPVTDMVTLDADKNVKRILSVLVMEQGMLRRIWEKNEPYEEHRWLKGDGIAYINTNIQFDYQTIQVKGKTFGEWDRIPTNYNADLAVFGAFDNWNRNLRIYAIAYRKRELRIGYGVNNANNNSLRIFQSDEDIDVFDVKMVFTEDRKNVTTTCVFNNSQEVSATTSNTAEVYPLSIIRLFNYYNDNAEFMTKFAIGDFRYGNTLHLTPVLLSRNILPNEDANGRARYKGEAVLVDKKKYKLGQPFVYGNIASSGSFSVSDED